MKAVGYYKSLPINKPDSLVDMEVPEPQSSGNDLLVQVKAISVNPVDTKLRKRITPPESQSNVPGFDAPEVVVKTGSQASLFKPGDPVCLADQSNWPGSNAEFQLVDERLDGRKPDSLMYSQAAALPLTAVTAYELLFYRIDILRDSR